jgi:hypothetical protein
MLHEAFEAINLVLKISVSRVLIRILCTLCSIQLGRYDRGGHESADSGGMYGRGGKRTEKRMHLLDEAGRDERRCTEVPCKSFLGNEFHTLLH